MPRFRSLSPLPVLAVVVALVAATMTLAEPVAASATSGHHRAWMLRQPGGTASSSTFKSAAAPAPNLKYYGGPVMTHPLVQSVLWGTGTYAPAVDGSGSPTMDDFFRTVLHSPYLAWLDEYRPTSGATGTRLGYGDFTGRTQITPAASGSTVSDSQIQAELQSQVSTGSLPAPIADGNGAPRTIYALFFPQNVTVCADASDCSGQQLCAYHGSVTIGGVRATYAVLPDNTVGPMTLGCGASSDALTNLETYTSHELVETLTDPAVGEATSYGPPLAWYDSNYGEIADICDTGTSQSQQSLGSFTVEPVWSNAAHACRATQAAPAAPTGVSAATMADGSVALHWAIPASAVDGYDVYAASPGQAGSGRIGEVVGTGGAWDAGWSGTNLAPGTVLSLVAESGTHVTSAPAVVTVPPVGSASISLSGSVRPVGSTWDITVKGTGPNPTGTVIAKDSSGTTIASAAVGWDGVAHVTVPRVATWSGATLAYSGDQTYPATTPLTTTLTGVKATSIVDASLAYASIRVGQSDHVTAQVGLVTHSPATNGTWRLVARQGAAAAITVASGSYGTADTPVTAWLTVWARTHVGKWALTFVYSGNANVAAANKAIGTMTVVKATPAVATAVQQLSGHRVSITVSLSAPVVATGRLTLAIAGRTYAISLTTAMKGRARFVVTLGPGSYRPTVRYGGNASLNPTYRTWTVAAH